MGWTPQHGHISQMRGGTGWNDCWEASLARYLRERGTGALPATDDALIAEVAYVARQIPDTPNNPGTDLPEADRSLAHYGIRPVWTGSFQAAHAAPWAICLVDGTLLRPAQYPASWFGDPGQGNHFVLWLPFWQESDAWWNDPLAWDNGQQDCQYAPASVAQAFYGAYLLPTTNHGETPPPRIAVRQACALKTQPSHTSVAIAHIPAGGQGLDLGRRAQTDDRWSAIQWRDRAGWVLTANLQERA